MSSAIAVDVSVLVSSSAAESTWWPVSSPGVYAFLIEPAKLRVAEIGLVISVTQDGAAALT